MQLEKEIAVWKSNDPNVVNLVEVIDDDEHHHCYLVSEIMPRGQVLPEEKMLTRYLLQQRKIYDRFI